MTIKVAKIDPRARIPEVKFDTDAGMDFYALDTVEIEPHNFRIVRTGIAVRLPPGTVGQLWPKSRSNFLIGGGIVDDGYQGEILFKVINPYSIPLLIYRHDAVGQMVVVENKRPGLVEEVTYADAFHQETERGATGGIVNQV